MTLAAQYFAAEAAFLRMEAALAELVEEACPAHTAYDWTADWYDQSIEVYSVEPVDHVPLWNAGFALVWIHRHKGPPRSNCSCPCLINPVKPAPWHVKAPEESA